MSTPTLKELESIVANHHLFLIKNDPESANQAMIALAELIEEWFGPTAMIVITHCVTVMKESGDPKYDKILNWIEKQLEAANLNPSIS